MRPLFLRYDREIKIALYARFDIPEAWLFDMGQRVLHVFRSPISGTYAEIVTVPKPGMLKISSLAPLAVDLSTVLDF